MTLVWLLIIFIVGVAYWIGLPFYWSISAELTVALVVFGHWILVNVLFHYYMALVTPPGNPPHVRKKVTKFLKKHQIILKNIFKKHFMKVEEIPHIQARCKKCQSAKPPRTHHCSVCRTCILRMDHVTANVNSYSSNHKLINMFIYFQHCPWLNNCVGHFNHRYFFLFMAYVVLGMIFLYIFGAPVIVSSINFIFMFRKRHIFTNCIKIFRFTNCL